MILLNSIFSDLALKKIPELFQCPMLTRQDRSQGLVEYIRDLLEAKFPVVPEIDDSLIGLGELGHGLPECTIALSLVIIPVCIDLDYPRHSDEFFFFNRPGMAFSPSHFISKPVYGNPKEPGLKTTGFGISDDFLRHRAKDRLGDLLREIGIAALGADEAKHPRRIAFDDGAPGILFTPRGPLKGLFTY